MGNSIQQFQEKDGLFGIETMTGATHAGFWANFLHSDHKNLAALAINLLSIPSSSASVERSFSQLKRIHTNFRASLTQTTIDNIMLVKWNALLKAKESTGSTPKKVINSADDADEESDSAIESLLRGENEELDSE